MSEGLGDTIKGRAKELVGKGQEAAGVLTGNPEQRAASQAKQAEGEADRAKGEVKHAIGQAKDAVKEAVREAIDDRG